MRGRLSGKTTRPSEKVEVNYPNPQQAVLEVTLDSPGLVVLADIYYPGWELTIDGKPATDLSSERRDARSRRLGGPSSSGFHLCPRVVPARAPSLRRRFGRIRHLERRLRALARRSNHHGGVIK